MKLHADIPESQILSAPEMADSDSAEANLERPSADAASSGRPQSDNGQGGTPATPQVSGATELRAVIEALLFVAPESLSLDRLSAVLDGVPKHEIRTAVRELQAEYDREDRGVQIVQVAGGYRVATRSDFSPWIKRLEKTKASPKLSRSALESLAIVAYKQPIVRSEIEKIRGVETSGVLRTLLERKLVRIVGRKNEPGRPILYGTTKYFLEHFGLADLADLPPLREFKELGESEQANLPIGDEPMIVGPVEEGAFAPEDFRPAVDAANLGPASPSDVVADLDDPDDPSVSDPAS
ncbi:MAG: SMC-Scp complex subunit ScpB [Nitrospirales bacterium]